MIELRIGDVFKIQVDESWSAIGQIAGNWNEELYVAIFSGPLERDLVDINKKLEESLALIGLTLDAKLLNGDWKILGNVTDNLTKMPQAAYKIRHSGETYIESRDRRITRIADSEEIPRLRYRSVMSPALLEEAVQAYFGNGSWKEAFDKLRPEYAYNSENILSS